MRFALLGDHLDGLAMAHALATSGRHQLVAYSGHATGVEYLRRWGIDARSVGDVEEILADPAIEAVIVASRPADRPAQLRRTLQSERHVLCVHPADDSPDIAYEAAMIQQDTRMVLLPILPDSLHPAVQRLAELLGEFRPAELLIEMERTSTEAALLEAESEGHDPGVPGWEILRALGGEIIEIVGFAAGEEATATLPLLLSGKFESGGIFQLNLLPRQPQTQWRLTARTAHGRIELHWPDDGPATLRWRDEHGEDREERWEQWDPWSSLVEQFEEAVGGVSSPLVRWHDEVRCLELDDAARRSVERRRASTLEYQEATEEAGFKGTMTLVGCGLLWGSLVLLLAAAWVPSLASVILPLFGLFLLFQLLRWFLLNKPVEGGGVQSVPVPPAEPASPHIKSLENGDKPSASAPPSAPASTHITQKRAP